MLILQWLEQPESAGADPSQCWHTLRLDSLPLKRPVLIRLTPAQASMAARQRSLVEGLLELLGRMTSAPGRREDPGKVTAPSLPTPVLEPLQDPLPGAALLEVVLADGHSPVTFQSRWDNLPANSQRAWILPLLPASPLTAWQTLPAPLQKRNIAFWHGPAMDELALTVLARAGVSDLDRRVFISYRRADTEPMAQQLFDALGRRNVSVFLDTVSVEPAVDFQARLFEQLADHSMVVVLHSRSFSQSTWARMEVEYAIAHHLSLLIVRLPDLPPQDVLTVSRSGDQLDLQPGELCPVEADQPVALTDAGLRQLVNTILRVHDVELIRRAREIRRRSLQAAQAQGLKATMASTGHAIHLDGPGAGVSLFPTVRPPAIADLHEASTADPGRHGPRRVVVGHAANLPAQRRALMDWALAGRDRSHSQVQICDVAMLDSLLRQINGSTP